jgi:hypothetical protein
MKIIKVKDIMSESDDLWLNILKSVQQGGSDIDSTKLHLTTSQVGYGRTKVTISCGRNFVGVAIINGEPMEGLDLTKVDIKIVPERSDSRKTLEFAIKSCQFFDTRRIGREGGYKIEEQQNNRIIMKSSDSTMRKYGVDYLPFVKTRLGILSNREERSHHNNPFDGDCDDRDYYDGDCDDPEED